MAKEDKLFKRTEAIITFLVGALAIIVAVMMVLLQEYFRIFPPTPASIIIQLSLSFIAYLFVIFLIFIVLNKSFGKKKR